jgi:hypothetical protein
MYTQLHSPPVYIYSAIFQVSTSIARLLNSLHRIMERHQTQILPLLECSLAHTTEGSGLFDISVLCHSPRSGCGPTLNSLATSLSETSLTPPREEPLRTRVPSSHPIDQNTPRSLTLVLWFRPWRLIQGVGESPSL